MSGTTRRLAWTGNLLQGYALYAAFSGSLIWPIIWPPKPLLYFVALMIYYAGYSLQNATLSSELLRKTRLAADEMAARQIQQTLQPIAVAQPSGYSVETFYRPFRAVSGDYFDVIPLSASRAHCTARHTSRRPPGDERGRVMPDCESPTPGARLPAVLGLHTEYLEFRQFTRSCSEVGAFRTGEANLLAGQRAFRVRSAIVDAHLSSALGVRSAQGRLFRTEDTIGSAAGVDAGRDWYRHRSCRCTRGEPTSEIPALGRRAGGCHDAWDSDRNRRRNGRARVLTARVAYFAVGSQRCAAGRVRAEPLVGSPRARMWWTANGVEDIR